MSTPPAMPSQDDRARNELVAVLSHELRTRLNAVLGWTRILRRGDVPPDRWRSILDTIERNAAGQLEIIEQLLELSAPADPSTRTAPPDARPADAPKAGRVTLRGRRVLAVDDDEATQELVATMLVMYGVSVRTAGRATDAMQILADWRPDVLLTDIAMPGEDGYALMRRVRALPSSLGSIPAVALTCFTDPESVQNAFAAGFDAHIGKPLEPHVLADALTKVLSAKRPT